MHCLKFYIYTVKLETMIALCSNLGTVEILQKLNLGHLTFNDIIFFNDARY